MLQGKNVNEDTDETTEEFEFGCRVFSRRIVFAYCKTTWDKNVEFHKIHYDSTKNTSANLTFVRNIFASLISSR